VPDPEALYRIVRLADTQPDRLGEFSKREPWRHHQLKGDAHIVRAQEED